jgi:hypothetical protein
LGLLLKTIFRNRENQFEKNSNIFRPHFSGHGGSQRSLVVSIVTFSRHQPKVWFFVGMVIKPEPAIVAKELGWLQKV